MSCRPLFTEGELEEFNEPVIAVEEEGYRYFSREYAIAQLLIAEAISLNTNHWRTGWTDEAKSSWCFLTNPGDVFQWGGSASDSLLYNEVESYYNYWLKDPVWGPAIFHIIKEGEMPQGPVENAIRKAGIWDLDALRTEHNIRPNCSNNWWRFEAKHRSEAFKAWVEESGSELDPKNWQLVVNWNQFKEAQPDTEASVWAKIREDAANWRKENGY